MNKDQAEGKWDEFTAKVKQQWGDLTDDEVKQSEGEVHADTLGCHFGTPPQNPVKVHRGVHRGWH
jgi:hypothetical protein